MQTMVFKINVYVYMCMFGILSFCVCDVENIFEFFIFSLDIRIVGSVVIFDYYKLKAFINTFMNSIHFSLR